MPFARKIAQLRTAKKSMTRFIGQSALNNSHIIEDAITEDQLYDQGIDGLGRSLGSYAPFTVQFKRTIASRLGRDTRIDHITLRDTGDFHKSIKVKLQRDGLKIESQPQKDDTNLIDEYGEAILFLTPENLDDFRNNFLLDDLRASIRAAL